MFNWDVDQQFVVKAQHDLTTEWSESSANRDRPCFEQLSGRTLDNCIARISSPRRGNTAIFLNRLAWQIRLLQLIRESRRPRPAKQARVEDFSRHFDQAATIGTNVTRTLTVRVGVSEKLHGYGIVGFHAAQRLPCGTRGLPIHRSQNSNFGDRAFHPQPGSDGRVEIIGGRGFR